MNHIGNFSTQLDGDDEGQSLIDQEKRKSEDHIRNDHKQSNPFDQDLVIKDEFDHFLPRTKDANQANNVHVGTSNGQDQGQGQDRFVMQDMRNVLNNPRDSPIRLRNGSMQNFTNQRQDNQFGSHSSNTHNLNIRYGSSISTSESRLLQNNTSERRTQGQNDVFSQSYNPQDSFNYQNPSQQSQIELDPINAHELIYIRKIPIWFPYKPYEAQIKYMEQVIDALNGGKNGLLQSPTGTGKTLCMLCATLAWAHENRAKKAKIYYCTRTHSQIKQVLEQLKKTRYRPATSILSSRSLSCVNIPSDNPHMSNSKLTKYCRDLRDCNGCTYYNPFSDKVYGGVTKEKLLKRHQMDLCDIEELCELGKKEKYCPHYLEKEKQIKADLVLLPYNYLFHKTIRKVNKINVQNSIIIIDEAHNVGNVLEETMTFSLSFNKLRKCDRDLDAMLQKLAGDPSLYQNGIVDLIDPLKNILGFMAKKKKELVARYQEESKEGPVESSSIYELKPPSEIFDIFKRKAAVGSAFQTFLTGRESQFKDGINIDNFNNFIELLKQAKGVQADNRTGSISRQFQRKPLYKSVKGLGSFIPFSIRVMKLLSMDLNSEPETEEQADGFIMASQIIRREADPQKFQDNHTLCYKLVIHLDGKDKLRSVNGGPNRYIPNESISANSPFYTPKDHLDLKISMVCLNPGIGFLHLTQEKPISLLLTSGTLAPFESFKSELFTDFPIELMNSHVIDTKRQCKTLIIEKGIGNFDFAFSERTRGRQMMVEAGRSLQLLAENIPNGMLVCFPSRRVMKSFLQIWKTPDCGIYNDLKTIKAIYEEPKDSKALQPMIQEYSRKAKSTGALLFCVCKGRISEGIDFEDEKARAVVLIGIHNLPIHDFKVVAKREFLNRYSRDFKGFDGRAWYNQESARAFNQAIGRVIRHSNDYGLVFLLDERYKKIAHMLPNWIQDNKKSYDNFEVIIQETKDFIARKEPLEEPSHQTQNFLAPLPRTAENRTSTSPIQPRFSQDLRSERPQQRDFEFTNDFSLSQIVQPFSLGNVETPPRNGKFTPDKPRIVENFRRFSEIQDTTEQINPRLQKVRKNLGEKFGKGPEDEK